MSWKRIEKNNRKTTAGVPDDKPVVYFRKGALVLTRAAYEALNHPGYVELLQDSARPHLLGLLGAEAKSAYSRRVSEDGKKFSVSLSKFIRENELHGNDCYYQLTRIDGVWCINLYAPIDKHASEF